MDDYDRDALLSAMYDTEEEPEKKDNVQIDPTGFQKSRIVRVGPISYELPTLDYVNRLEQLIVRQGQLIERQRRQLERLQGAAIGTRNFIRRQTGRLQDMQNDLDSKVDYREYP